MARHDFRYVMTTDPVWKYRLPNYYEHAFYVRPNLLGNREVVSDFYIIWPHRMVLKANYTWNGSNAVVDLATCMRASAVHDAWAQAMDAGLMEQSWSNWNRGAREYRKVCRADGMSRTRSMTRYLGVLFGGGNGYKWKHLRRQLERKL